MKRLTLNELRENFDKVCLWYEKEYIETDQGLVAVKTGNTIAVLHDGEKRYVGISKLNDADIFNHKKGRTMALGRALFAFEVDCGQVAAREKHLEIPLSFNLVVTTDPEPFSVLIGSDEITIPAWMLKTGQRA